MVVNLDFLCANYGKSIGEKERGNRNLRNLIQKSLGIIQEDGFYSFYVYLKSEGAFKNQSLANTVLSNIWSLLGNSEINLVNGEYEKSNVENKIQSLCKNLDKLTLAKAITEKALIYARYHADAKLK